jgi:hypothetical protein
MTLEPDIWGPPYWFVLHTIALTYPYTPNEVIKKKYYEFYQNLPLFLPIEEIGNQFSVLLDTYPVTPYLDSRQSLMRWTHFIHNRVNASLRKPTLTFEEAMAHYYEHYKPKQVKDLTQLKRREKYVFLCFMILLIVLILYLYHN